MSDLYVRMIVAMIAGFLAVVCITKASTFPRPKAGEKDPAQVWVVAAVCWLIAFLIVLVSMGVTAARDADDDPVEVLGWTTETFPS